MVEYGSVDYLLAISIDGISEPLISILPTSASSLLLVRSQTLLLSPSTLQACVILGRCFLLHLGVI